MKRALDAIRIGCVGYLNARPLVYGCEARTVFASPAVLATLLSSGKLDVALVPVYELLQQWDYLAVDGVSISSFGPVFSVFMAYRGALEKIRSVSLDNASVTSNQLLRCLLGKFERIDVEFTASDESADARLLIGDHAINFRRENGDSYTYYDLGEQWTRHTGLPFVYALWLIRPEVGEPAPIAARLREMCETGVANIEKIAAKEKDKDFARWYLSECLRYGLGNSEKMGMQRFAELLADCGVIECAPKKLSFI